MGLEVESSYFQATSSSFLTIDAEIIEKLNSVPSKNNYVRQLILQDLEREKKEANK